MTAVRAPSFGGVAAPPAGPSIAVTGIGVVSPLGVGQETFWTALCEGRSGVEPLSGMELPDGPRFAAQVRGFEAREFITSTHLRRMDKLSRMIVAASRMASDDAGALGGAVSAERVAVVIGSAFGNVSESEIHLRRLFAKGPAFASPMIFPNLVHNAPASYVSMELGLRGVNFTVSQGEISGEQAILVGCDLLRAGRADAVLAGGGDELAAIVCEVYRRGGALAGRRGSREWASPYDTGRSGVVLGEGAAMLCLEPLPAALARGAAVYARIDAVEPLSIPAPRYDWPATAASAVERVQRLLAGAGANRIDLICGSANSSRRLDACEIELFARVFGESASRIWLTSIKGAVGEFGAAGALSAAATCMALRQQMVPPLCHMRRPEPRQPFRLPAGTAVAAPLAAALLFGMGRGGNAAAMAISEP